MTQVSFFDRYIFFSDKVEIQDITKQTSMFVLLGPKSSKVCVLYLGLLRFTFPDCFSFFTCPFCPNVVTTQIMEVLNLGDLVGKAYGSHKHYSVSFHYMNFEVLSCLCS